MPKSRCLRSLLTALSVPAQVVLLSGWGAAVRAETAFRPPAVPLAANDPYLSIWSEADHLTDSGTVHWTGHPAALVSLIRVDGRAYRVMGDDPAQVPALPQTSLRVTPTRSIYKFGNGAVHVTLTFMTADLPHDLDVFSRPLSYLTWSVQSADGKAHAVSLYSSASSEMAVNSPDQPVVWQRETMGPLTALRVGTAAQTLLRPAGDDVRIDWGYAYAVAPAAQTRSAVGSDAALTAGFAADGRLPGTDDTRQPRPVSDDEPVLAFTFDLGRVGLVPVSRHLMIGYDELYAVKLAGTKLRPYWRRNGATPATLFQSAERDYPSLLTRCAAFDQHLTAEATRIGGARYAQIVALAYRQSLAANGLAVDAHGQPLLFTKENTSNGDIATVDVLFPQSPVLLLLSPTLAKASVAPVLAYASSPVWKFPNSPHDLGTYPLAAASGAASEEMPVEESGNMLILCDAICQEDGNAGFVAPYWPKLTQWAEYLAQYGLDPEDQLCTDDFMGHLAHNANLSVKAIIALAAYGDMCRRRGDTADAQKYAALARVDAAHWVAVADSGPVSRLTFDKPGTWSQKYNMVWDKVLGLNVFGPAVRAKEVAYYKSQLNTYGIPLDSRTLIGDTDHSFFSAALADNEADFEALASPFYDFLDQTTARLPMVDTYQVNDLHSGGFHARPVVGGVFVKMLADRAAWRRWSAGDKVAAANWAPLPGAPAMTVLLPSSQRSPVLWRYTTTANPPPAGWTLPGFDDSGWKTGNAPFGSKLPGGIPAGTVWDDTPGDLWIRRTVTLPPGDYSDPVFQVYHDDGMEVYVNGIPAADDGGYNNGYEEFDISPAAKALLKPGAAVTIAAHVHQTAGGQGLDLGLADLSPPGRQ